MTLPSETTVLAEKLPPGYEQVLYWRITEKTSRLVIMQVLSFPLFIIAIIGFFALAFVMGALPRSGRFSLGLDTLVQVGVLLVGMLLVLVLHELVHGQAMKLFGAKPQYGVMWKQGVFYATSPGYPFLRNNYLVVALAPLVVISLLSIPAMLLVSGTEWVSTIAILAAINAGGAIGDLWMSLLVVRYPPHAYFVDERDGVRVFLPGKDQP